MAEAETTEVVENEDESYDAWLAALEDDEEDAPAEAEVKAEHDDDKAMKVARKTQKVVTEFVTEEKIKSIDERFGATASDDAKRLVAIWRRGDEDPKQLKALMELAKTKTAETAPDPEAVEKEATRKAREAYGVAPLAQGTAVEPDEWEEARERVRRGDTRQAFAMWNSLPGSGVVSTPD